MAVTIYQVAEAAGVSPSTVSNVLNGRDGRMLPQTRRRVEQAMTELGYHPNRAARQLRTGRSSAIGLIVPSVANPFWGAFARHLEAAALAQGYHVLLCNSERDPARERTYVEELWADGGTHLLQPPEEIRTAATELGFPSAALEAVGHDAVEARMAGSYEQFVASGEFTFRLRDEAVRLGDVVRFHWDTVPATGGAAVGGGLEVLLLDADGRIRADHMFPGD